MEKKSGWGSKLNSVLAIINIAAFIFYAGVTWSRINSVEALAASSAVKVNTIETSGTVGFQKYVAADTAEASALKARLSTVEMATASLPIIQADLRVIQSKLDNLKEQLSRHEAIGK